MTDTAARKVPASRTFRVFISSTFEDLKAERNALQRYVFPKLAELCAGNNARFQAIDLRWGVSEEASLDQRAIAICLTEIERCQRVTPRPNFLVLLGDRYGWRPLPARINAVEFQAILARVPDADAKLLTWAAEQPADGKGWYRRDNNAVPAEYVLRPREVRIPGGATQAQRKAAQDAEYEAWKATEARLRAILLGAIESLGWSEDDEAMTKYIASATEQEIVRGALAADNAAEHVFAFFRSVKTEQGEPLTEHVPADGSAAGFIDQSDLSGTPGLDMDANGRLGALKAKLKKVLGDHVLAPYEATWTGTSITTDHLGDLPETLTECLALLSRPETPHTLCADVWRSLAGVIKSQLDQAEAEEAIEREIRSHTEFGEARCRDFVGRDAIRHEIASYLDGSEPQPLALIGEGGSGKSALMAKALAEAGDAHPGAIRVARFIGATAASSDGRSLLSSLCRHLARSYSRDETSVPAEYNDLAVEFGKQLANATADRPLIVFLDALDQFGVTDPARSLSWLPARLPGHVRMVVSILPGDCETSLRARRPPVKVLSLGKMTRQEGETALGLWLGHAQRKLQNWQHQEVLDKFEPEGRPLYLKLAFEEARLWHSFSEPAETGIHASIPMLITGNLFTRLAAPQNHGQRLVAHALGYLAASRYGLAEDELIAVLSADDDVMTDFHNRSPHSPDVEQLPVVVWSRLFFDLEPYLSERAADGATLLAFYHRVLGEAAARQYLAGADGPARHSALAGYFEATADPGGGKTWTAGSVRGLGELPFHLANADLLDDLYATLTDFRFLEHKAAEVGVTEHRGSNGTTVTSYSGVFALQEDYAIALAKMGGGGTAGRRPLIVTAAEFGKGLVVGCRWCNKQSPLKDEWRGADIACPQCKRLLRVNEFVVRMQS